MISFRYHVVTIVAVFLALAIGLLGGAAFVQPALQEELQNQTDRLRRDLADRTRQIEDLREQIGALGGFAEAAMPYLTSGKLSATPVVLVSQVGVEDECSHSTGVARPSRRADPHDGLRDRARLRRPRHARAARPDVGGTDGTGRGAARPRGRRARPASPASRSSATTSWPSSSRRASSPVGAGPSAATLDEIGADGQVVVVLSGGRGEQPVLAPEAFAVPLTEQLADLGVPVAAGESLLSDYDYVSLVRSNGTEGTVTVDDLDQTMGGAALVLGLEELLATGNGGAYGVKDGAEPLPPLP